MLNRAIATRPSNNNRARLFVVSERSKLVGIDRGRNDCDVVVDLTRVVSEIRIADDHVRRHPAYRTSLSRKLQQPQIAIHRTDVRVMQKNRVVKIEYERNALREIVFCNGGT